MASQTDNKFTWGNQVDGFLHTFVAEGIITEGQLLELGSAGRQVKEHTGTTTVPIIGIAHESAANGKEVVVCCSGPIRKVISNGSMTRGQFAIPSGASGGKCATMAFAGATHSRGVIGIALETGDEDGERVPVLMNMSAVAVIATS